MNYWIILLMTFHSCAAETSDSIQSNATEIESKSNSIIETAPHIDSVVQFSREGIRKRIDSIKKVGGNLYVHCLVPLCDNDNQGIVPVSESLGDGLNLKTNLYWATGHGMKAYFQKSKRWKTIKIYNPESPDILERCVFRAKIERVTIYLVTDGYRGDRMPECLEDYFNALAGNKKESVEVDSIQIMLSSNADLVVFNGHNGLMDNSVKEVKAVDNKEKDAIAIGCISNEYFKSYFFKSRAYPLVMTTGLIYPGAFIIDAIIFKWALNAPEIEIRYAAGDAYNRVMKCGQGGGRNLFSTGWDG